MSGKKLVKFEAADKRVKGSIPTAVAPDAVMMQAKPDGDRTQEEFQATPLRAKDAVDEQFPTDALTQSDPRDELMNAKLELGDGTGITPFGQLIAKDSDFQWLQKKREVEAEANFQQWFALNFDKMSPEQKKIARELWPEFYQQRVALLQKDIELVRRIAQLNITGIQTRDDLLLQYAIETGYIDVDRLDCLMHPEKNHTLNDSNQRQLNFQRGLLNPNRLPRGAHNLRVANASMAVNRNFTPGGTEYGIGNQGFNVQGLPEGGRGYASEAYPTRENFSPYKSLLSNATGWNDPNAPPPVPARDAMDVGQ